MNFRPIGEFINDKNPHQSVILHSKNTEWFFTFSHSFFPFRENEKQLTKKNDCYFSSIV